MGDVVVAKATTATNGLNPLRPLQGDFGPSRAGRQADLLKQTHISAYGPG